MQLPLSRRYDYLVRYCSGLKMSEEEKERIFRFIEAFEQRYGRKPTLEDAEGDFKLQVARDMQMSVGGAHYYIRLASERTAKEK